MLTLRTTAEILPKDRLDYWRNSVLHRMDPIASPDSRSFAGKMVHIAGKDCDFVDHASEPIHTRRDTQRLRRDDCDEIVFTMVGRGGSAHLTHAGQHKLRGGDLVVSDFSRPIELMRSRHRDISLVFKRERLAESLKGDFPRLAARLLPRAGMAALLRSHLQSLAEEAERLSNGERAVALMAASDMALMAFQKASQIPIDTERFAMGLYAAARTYIGRNFWNPDLGPDMIAAALGCSRAKLYRAFGGEDTSVAKTIWNERLDQVCCMLAAPEHSAAFIADIAFRGGFTDMPTFNRMFKSRFGKTPTEARPQG